MLPLVCGGSWSREVALQNPFGGLAGSSPPKAWRENAATRMKPTGLAWERRRACWAEYKTSPQNILEQGHSCPLDSILRKPKKPALPVSMTTWMDLGKSLHPVCLLSSVSSAKWLSFLKLGSLGICQGSHKVTAHTWPTSWSIHFIRLFPNTS